MAFSLVALAVMVSATGRLMAAGAEAAGGDKVTRGQGDKVTRGRANDELRMANDESNQITNVQMFKMILRGRWGID